MWQGLSDLRESLLQRGMLNEALALFKLERSRLPPAERLDTVLEFQDYIRKKFPLSKPCSLWIEADLAIYAAQSLYETQEGDKGAAMLVEAEKLLAEWCSLVGYQQEDTLTPALEIKLIRLRYFSDELLLYYKESTELLEIMRRCCHASTTVCYGHAIDAASQLMTPSETDPYRVAFYGRLEERQHYQERVLEDIRGMLSDQAPLFTEASSNIALCSNKVLEWLYGFYKKYPKFNIPQGLEFIARRRRMIYVHRRQSDKQQEEEAKLNRLKDMVPRQIGPLVAVRKPKPAANRRDRPSRPEPAFGADIDEDNFYMTWVDLAGKSKETRDLALQFLVQWLIDDFAEGVISDWEIFKLLAIESEGQGSSGITAQLEALRPDSTFRRLYDSEKGSPETVIEVDLWAEKLEILKSWLHRPSKPTLNGRQYLWVVLQEIRAHSTIDLKAPVDIIVLEIEKCISIAAESLRPKVREVVTPGIIIWRGRIADQYFRYCMSTETVFNTAQVGEYLTLSVDIGLEIIDELQKAGEIMQSAARQRTTAEMCLFKLYWMLLQQGKSLSDSELAELQTTGLECLDQADEFFTPLLREATWSHGLESVQERERSISTSTSWRIPQLAVRLLVAGGIPSDEEKRKAIWTWVQRSKARALAMAIGTSGTVPAALIEKVMASDQHRLLYEEMSALENQIKTVEPHNRFALRQELDSHIENMRKHRLLAEICDIREGKALSLPDLDMLHASAGSSFVLADWFYVRLNAYDEDSILLLTAKPGSTPTVDVLPLTPPKVTRWINNNLEGEFSDYTEKITSELEPLVQQLVNTTKPGDVLVFCPSSSLHRIPLHSIDVEEDDEVQPMIYRNPIVYIHSHSVLRRCLWNAHEAAEAQSPLKPLIMNGIPDTPKEAGRSAGRASVQDLATSMNVRPYIKSSGTKANFLSEAPSSRLIHVHSHIKWTDADPLAHSIHFAPPPSATPEAGPPKSVPHSTPTSIQHTNLDTTLTAREIFALSFPLGSHVSLIACSGGLARISPEDEVMGLVPALLHAGASSTLSTLWPIKDRVGAEFSKAFYGSLERGRKAALHARGEGRGGVDLAKAFQDAAIERDKVEREAKTLHWTAFVMHGFWQFWMPPVDGDEAAN